MHWRIALAAWMTLIFVGSSSLLASWFSADATEEVFGLLNYIVRKSVHMSEYGVLAYLWLRSIWRRTDRFGKDLAWSVALAVAYASTDEYHQTFVPQRLGIWTDVVWDAGGATIMACVLWLIRQRGPAGVRRWVLGPAGASGVVEQPAAPPR